jgi:putative phage-type endonuclease
MDIENIVKNVTISSTIPRTNVKTNVLHPRVRAVLERPRIMQHTDNWFNERKLRLTASDIAGVMGLNPYSHPKQIFKKKTGRGPPRWTSFSCQHGLATEEEARKVYEVITGIEMMEEDVGLLVHEKLDFIGASPDGIAKYVPILLEIKCPTTRKIIQSQIPSYYIPQIQIQMEVCNIDECHFMQYRPPTTFENGVVDIVSVKRDNRWFREECLPILSEFWHNVVEYYISIDKPIGTQVENVNEMKKKKKNIVTYSPFMFIGNLNKYDDKLISPKAIRTPQPEFAFVVDVHASNSINITHQ